MLASLFVPKHHSSGLICCRLARYVGCFLDLASVSPDRYLGSTRLRPGCCLGSTRVPLGHCLGLARARPGCCLGWACFPPGCCPGLARVRPGRCLGLARVPPGRCFGLASVFLGHFLHSTLLHSEHNVDLILLPLLVSLLHLIVLHSGHPLCPPIVGSSSEIYQGLAVRHRRSDLKDLHNVPRRSLRNGQDARYKEDLRHLQERLSELLLGQELRRRLSEFERRS